jgi:radical SAM family uncharacterized protein
MKRKVTRTPKKSVGNEKGTIIKNWHGRIRVALVYPNTYLVGMSSLGFQSVYGLLNRIDHVVCERAFLNEPNHPEPGHLVTRESGRPLKDFDIVAFSISFENDYPNILKILEAAGIPFQCAGRNQGHPLVMAGGVACFLNPEPIAPFMDCFLIGEAEAILPPLFDLFDPAENRETMLTLMARKVPGTYVPAFFTTAYHGDGTLKSFHPERDIPEKIKRATATDIANTPTCSSIITDNTLFQKSFLVEVARGCPHGCRFCSAGYVYRPPRFRTLGLLEKCLIEGSKVTNKIGLVGTAVSDLPHIEELCALADKKKIQLTFSSLRADALTPGLISALKQANVKTATIAPDAGSERMRRVINKGLTEETILTAAEKLVANGIPNLKLYFMVGLPTETGSDVEAIITLCKKIKDCFLQSSRTRKRIGTITVSLNSFVPKPATPFQWVAMEEIKSLKQKIKIIRNSLASVPNIRVHANAQRWAHLQALFSRGDRRVAMILELAHKNNGNWAKTLKETSYHPDFYIHRQRDTTELLPWDFIDHGINKSFLIKEYTRALAAKPSAPCPLTACQACGVC